jgi:hypothetical protein
VDDAQLAVGPDHAVLHIVSWAATQRLRHGLGYHPSILRMDELLQLSKGDRGLLWRQPKDAEGFIRPGDVIRVEVTFPVADMREALGFLESGLAPTQTIQRLLETGGHESERLREHADFIISLNLGYVSPFPLCDRLRRLRQGGQRSQRAPAHPEPEDHEDSDDSRADGNREIRRTIHRSQEIRGGERRDDGPGNLAGRFKAIDSRIDPALLGIIEGKCPRPC